MLLHLPTRDGAVFLQSRAIFRAPTQVVLLDPAVGAFEYVAVIVERLCVVNAPTCTNIGGKL